MTHRRMHRPTNVVRSTVLLLALGAISGCSNGDNDAVETSPAELAVVASDIAFDAPSYAVVAGDVEVSLTLTGVIPHTLVIEDESGRALDLLLTVRTDAPEDTATIDLAPGTYVLFCEIAGHRAAGQEATLTVE